jgi:hypothetical protein
MESHGKRGLVDPQCKKVHGEED